MEFKNKVEVKFPGIEECHLEANHDCSMGKIFDYACALRSFAVQRMQEEEAKSKAEAPKEEITNPEG
jgi:hypothetical protein